MEDPQGNTQAQPLSYFLAYWGFRPSHCTNSGSTATKPSVLSWEMPLYAARLHASLGTLHCEARLAELPS
ncbi:hypothetical protein BDA96_01G488000 [Sorghum bicolor]|uniref:Uncharacterized protein n=1 Tax=Sorghum bicolor TaxID=4558 RepID=A0A921V1H4_SORBI|nr:hypothetical protein BDA96_01G488000 [Sorghum bicolor]